MTRKGQLIMIPYAVAWPAISIRLSAGFHVQQVSRLVSIATATIFMAAVYFRQQPAEASAHP